MKILFSVGNLGFLRNFEPALRLLAARGHQLHIVAERKDSVGGTKTLDLLQQQHPDRISYSYAPSRKDSYWQALATQLRLALDYWRYLDPRYDDSPSLRARGAAQAPAIARHVMRLPLARSRPGLALMRRIVRSLERAIPHGSRLETFLRSESPDVLLLTPLLYFGSQQVEYVRAARALGIRTVLGVGSWDHLTTKGLVHECPDRVVVWNEAQRTEAADLHGIPPERVTVTGAQAYDHWFVQQPSLSREAFCGKVGVPPDRPLLLYLCSSPFIAPHEVPFVRRWIDAIRASADPVLRDAAILVRPHPQNAEQWRDFTAADYQMVGIWPRTGANPVDVEARADYFDSMFYSHAVVGVNTSALIESGIVGRPVYTVLAEDFAGQQEGTLHFQHLKNINGGLLTAATSLSEHVGQLSSAVRRQSVRDDKSTAFIEAFVRPYGLSVPAADRFVEAIEAQVVTSAPAPVRRRLWQRFLALLLRPAALAAAAHARRRRAEKRGADVLPARPAHFLFAVASPEYLRYFDSTMQLLADRGHQVSVAVNWLRERKKARLHDLVADERIEVIGLIPKRSDLWTPMARGVRGTIDFVRYLDRRYADAPALRARMHRKALPRLLAPLDRITSLSEPSVRRAIRCLQAIERAIPVSPRVRRFLEAHEPDVVVVSPLVDASSDQVDLVRASHAAGIRTVAAIASWDNLTNKGHMRVVPDLVTVWNEHQREEAITLHAVPADRIAVTGAQLFDRWFDREPSQSREALCAMVGLPTERAIVLYTGSSVFIARSEIEAPFARRWIETLRKSDDPSLRDAAILIRPHPFNCDAWVTTDFSDLGPVAVWPRHRYTPAAEMARNSLYDSLYYSAAVVGINTSAMIEAAILGKPVLSITTGDFAGTQEGTLHFRYLLPENGGFLRVASTLTQHADQLADVLRDPAVTREQTLAFVRRFLRPHGMSVPCTPILAHEFERVAAAGARGPGPDAFASKVLRLVVWPVAAVTNAFARGRSPYPPRPPLHRRMRRFARKAMYETYAFVRRAWIISVSRVTKRTRRFAHATRRIAYRAAHEVRATTRHAMIIIASRVSKRTRHFAHATRRITYRAAHEVRATTRHAIAFAYVRALKRPMRRGITVLRRTRLFARRVTHLARYESYSTLRRATAIAYSHTLKRPVRRVIGVGRRTQGFVTRCLTRDRRLVTVDQDTHSDRRVARSAAGGTRPLRVLFSMRNFWYVRLYDAVIRSLAARGHHVHILAEQGEHNEVSRDWNEAAAALSRDFPNITFSWSPSRIEDDWVDLRIMVRLGLDHLRFLQPQYRDATQLAARARARTPQAIVSLADRPLLRTRRGRALIALVLRVAERAMPVDPDVVSCIRERRADVVLITPLLTLGSEQIDVLRTSRRLGIPTALCVGSWDHLSSKALIRERPHRVFVWNETQRREAIDLHGVPEHEVMVTGAQCFDEWFDRSPTLDREAFCRKVGLDPSRPYVLYVCSALFEGSPNEAEFAARWLRAIRERDVPLRSAGVLFRPHPKRGFEWDAVDLSGFDNVAVWPPRGAAPFDEPTKADYFDSMFHSAAVVGLNTSALIEAGIVGRAVHTILLPEFRENQEGTLHFRYLLDLGLLRAVRDLDTHVEQLSETVKDDDPSVHHNRSFVEAFVRPRGLHTPSTPVFVQQVEELGLLSPPALRDPFWVPLLLTALTPLAYRTSGTFAEQIGRARRRRAKSERRAEEKRLLREQRVAKRTAEREAREREREVLAKQRAAQKLAAELALKERVLRERAAKHLEKQRHLEERVRREEAQQEKARRREARGA